MSQRSSDRGLTVGVPCRLNIFERHIVARTCALKRLEESCRGTRETDGIVATVHNVDAVVLDLTYLIKELSAPHKASVQHVVHLERGEWHEDLGRLKNRGHALVVLIEMGNREFVGDKCLCSRHPTLWVEEPITISREEILRLALPVGTGLLDMRDIRRPLVWIMVRHPSILKKCVHLIW